MAMRRKVDGDQVLALRDQGLTYDQICKKLNCTHGSVAYYLTKSGISKCNMTRGQQFDLAKKAMELRQSGMQVKDVCEYLGVSSSHLRYLWRVSNMKITRKYVRKNDASQIAPEDISVEAIFKKYKKSITGKNGRFDMFKAENVASKFKINVFDLKRTFDAMQRSEVNVPQKPRQWFDV